MGLQASQRDDGTDEAVAAVPRAVWSLVPERLIRDRVVFPVGLEGQLPRAWLVVATTCPSDLAMADEIAFVTGLRVKLVEASVTALRRLIALHLGSTPEVVEPRLPEPEAIELPEDDGPALQPSEWMIPLAPGDTKWR